MGLVFGFRCLDGYGTPYETQGLPIAALRRAVSVLRIKIPDSPNLVQGNRSAPHLEQDSTAMGVVTCDTMRATEIGHEWWVRHFGHTEQREQETVIVS